ALPPVPAADTQHRNLHSFPTRRSSDLHTDDPTHPETHKFTAELVPPRRAGVAKRHEFVPTTFSRQFSALNKPVLTIIPGDSSGRSEEHTSELQSLRHLVCRLLPEKKKY